MSGFGALPITRKILEQNNEISSSLFQPAAPVASPATDAATFSFTANWQPSAGAVCYLLTVTTDSAGLVPVSSAYKRIIVTDTRWPVTGLSAETTYYYYVEAHGGRISPRSNIITQATLPDDVLDSRLMLRLDTSLEPVVADGTRIIPADRSTYARIVSVLGAPLLGGPFYHGDRWKEGTGKPVMGFSTNEGLVIDNPKVQLSNPSTGTFIAAVRNPTTTPVQVGYLFYHGDVLGDPLFAVANDSPIIYVRRGGPPGIISSKQTNPTDWGRNVALVRRIVTIDYNGTHALTKVRFNGAEEVLTTVSGGDPGTAQDPAAAERICVGCRTASTTLSLNMHIAELRYYQPRLTDAEIAKVETIFLAKWPL